MLQRVACCTMRTVLTHFLQLVACELTSNRRQSLYHHIYRCCVAYVGTLPSELLTYLSLLFTSLQHGTRRIPEEFPHLQWRAVQSAVQTSRAASLHVAERRLLLCSRGLSKAARSTPKLCGGYSERLGECNLGPIKSAYLAEAGR